MAKRRVTLPQNALGPVSRQGDKARIQDKVIADAQAKARAASKAKPASESVRQKPAYKRPGTPAEAAQRAMVGMKAPGGSVRPNRAGAAFTPGSKADMAYTGVKQAEQKLVRPRRLGSGVEGALLTAAAATALSMANKYQNRDRKLKQPKKGK